MTQTLLFANLPKGSRKRPVPAKYRNPNQSLLPLSTSYPPKGK